MSAPRSLLATALLLLTSSCAYLKTVANQTGYAMKQAVSPAQHNYKHMLSRETFFVFGEIPYVRNLNSEAVAVVAVSDDLAQSEVVDVSYAASLDSYYGVHLPEGDFSLLVVSDINRDGFYEAEEVVGRERVSLSLEAFPEKVVAGKDIAMDSRQAPDGITFRVPVVWTAQVTESLFYPRGSIRPLSDPMYSPQMASLGLYSPARFLELAPMMFYALEEDLPHKIPIVFVHGISGSARDFEDVVANLDRSRFRAWFFHYPSGMGLDQLASMFHQVFLSGEVIFLGEMPLIIVAHSMGGLVAREALNLQSRSDGEAQVHRLITVASPFGGHPAVRGSHRAPVIIPSWRDLHPDGDFILGLSRKPLPEQVEHYLLYLHNGRYSLDSERSTDGSVPLSSQLAGPSRDSATAVHGFEESHAEAMANQEIIRLILRIAGEVRSPYPEEHLRELEKGGFPFDLGPNYTSMEAYYLNNYGVYMHAMATGKILPVAPDQERFVQVANGKSAPEREIESAWVKFSREFPGQFEASSPARRN